MSANRPKLGPPVLRVRNARKMIAFYHDILGLEANYTYHDPNDNLETTNLGFKDKFNDTTDSLLILKHDYNAREVQHNFAGLFHFALLVPDRKSLAQAYSVIAKRVHFDGFADHLVSESLYLHDPEHNGIEIYRDRPREEWRHDKDGHITIDTLSLDIGGLLRELSEEKKNSVFPRGAIIGHVHLRVTNLERSVKFYHEKLGFDISADWSSMGAMFLSSEGYHHHIALNTWSSLGGISHKTGDVGLERFTIRVSGSLRQLKSRLSESSTIDGELLVSDPDNIPVSVVEG